MLLLTSLEDSILIKEFNEKVKEIDTYFLFLETISKNEKGIYISNVESSKNDLNLNSDVICILKANLFLMLYNLIESSFKLALESLLHDINLNKLEFKYLKPEIQNLYIKHVLESLKIKQSNYNDPNNLKNFIIRITNETINFKIIKDSNSNQKDTLFGISGNLDADEISKVKERLGIELIDKNIKSNDLQTIKYNRNNLAHGDISFSECGRNYSIVQVKEIKDNSIKYMQEVLININNYIDNKIFKENYTEI